MSKCKCSHEWDKHKKRWLWRESCEKLKCPCKSYTHTDQFVWIAWSAMTGSLALISLFGLSYFMTKMFWTVIENNLAGVVGIGYFLDYLIVVFSWLLMFLVFGLWFCFYWKQYKRKDLNK